MDKALKQRLVGASVLVALAVIVLPMLLDGQPEPGQDTRPIEIPPRPAEVTFERRRFPVGEQAPDQPSVVPEGAIPRLDTTGEDRGSPAPAATLQERLEQVAAESAAASSDAPDPSPSAETASTVNPAFTPESAPPRVVDQVPDGPEEAMLADSGEPPAPPAQVEDPVAADLGGRYLVQVASFSSTANANRLAGSLKDSGLPVLMDTVDSTAGVLHRVRVGPFDQRAQAEQVVARLGRQIPDVRPRLVDLRPDEKGPVTEPDDPLIRWVVQVGVFSDAENAEQLVYALRDAGFRAVSQSESSDGNTVYRVRVGPEVERADAVVLKERILAEQGIEGFVQSTE